MSTRYVWRIRRGLNSYIGQIGERLAISFLEGDGFEVMSFMFLADMSRHLMDCRPNCPYSVHFPMFIERYPHALPQLLRPCNPRVRTPTRDACDFLGPKKNFIELNQALDKIDAGAEHKRRRYDFVARKEGKYYVVEVKTNKGQLRKSQKEELQHPKRFGFLPMIVKTKVTLIADQKM